MIGICVAVAKELFIKEVGDLIRRRGDGQWGIGSTGALGSGHDVGGDPPVLHGE